MRCINACKIHVLADLVPSSCSPTSLNAYAEYDVSRFFYVPIAEPVSLIPCRGFPSRAIHAGKRKRFSYLYVIPHLLMGISYITDICSEIYRVTIFLFANIPFSHRYLKRFIINLSNIL